MREVYSFSQYEVILTTEEACEALRVGYNTLYLVYFRAPYNSGLQNQPLKRLRKIQSYTAGVLLLIYLFHVRTKRSTVCNSEDSTVSLGG